MAVSAGGLLCLQRFYQPLYKQPGTPEGTRASTPSASYLFTGRRRRSLCTLFAIATIIALVLGLGLHYGLHKDDSDNIGPVIDLGYAQYRGNYLNNGISEFLQMRFAQPPTGDLRWRAPIEPKFKEGVQKAKEFGPICLGVYQAADELVDEDCLFANVWAPTNATAGMKLPVIVFIQGGGYTLNANANWNGSQLVETSDHNVVLVNFNYRVGLWGFLAGEEVKRDGKLNAGLLDQRFVLKWVRRYISRFGGDPDHVVIHGISAGAGAVALQLVAYGGLDQGLFAAAISESTFFPAQPRVSDLQWQFNRTVVDAGCEGAKDKMKCLRGMSKKKLQLLNRSYPFPGQSLDPLFYWTPCIDGDFLRDYPYKLFESGKFVKVPILSGSCTNEGSVFAPNASTTEHFSDFLQINYPRLDKNTTLSIIKSYPLEEPLPYHAEWYPSAARAYGEATFICPTNNILNIFHKALSGPNSLSDLDPSSIWAYRYNVQDAIQIAFGVGVSHVFEAPAVFGPDMLPPYAVPQSYWTYNADMVPLTMRYWLSFVRTFNPNTYRLEGTPEWESWGSEQKRLLMQLHNTTMETVDSGQQTRCEMWKGKAELMQQ